MKWGSLRLRLTLWNLTVLALALGIVSVALTFGNNELVMRDLNRELRMRALRAAGGDAGPPPPPMGQGQPGMGEPGQGPQGVDDPLGLGPDRPAQQINSAAPPGRANTQGTPHPLPPLPQRGEGVLLLHRARRCVPGQSCRFRRSQSRFRIPCRQAMT